eukprot:TRINITY_DN24843_c0_g1_i1.p1 TRINITY_DN24843_c0_g1~~TRINITY_DN24843_c0_g1_i1.p1  ORF type:complete len:213 (+),score=56.66 TRINITY_DN24843_c0_g1_i1:27-641(+)
MDPEHEEVEEYEEEEEEEEEPAAQDEEAEGEVEAVKPARSLKGVVYMSRIPFGMNPVVLRNMFTEIGPVGKMYLKPKELKGGGKKKRQARLYSEGWIEFKNKKHAKHAALLNNTPVGGTRKQAYSHELWNIKYLSGFTWEDLQEEQIIKKEYMKREVTRVKKQGLKDAEEYRKTLQQRKRKRSYTPRSDGGGKKPVRRSCVVIE